MKNNVTKAVRQLREALGDTQQQFAHRLNMAISTVVRYELTRPPKGKVLRRLEALAIQHHRSDLARLFRESLAAELGLSLRAFTRYPTEGNDLDVAALLWIKAHPEKYAQELAIWEQISHKIKPALQVTGDQIASVELAAAGIAKLTQEGKTRKEIEKSLDVDFEGRMLDYGPPFRKRTAPIKPAKESK